MKYIYIIIFNTSNDNKSNDNKSNDNSTLIKYRMKRYSFLLKNNNIPLIKVNKNINIDNLIKFYFREYINIDSLPIISIKLFKKYKNVEYILVDTKNFINTKINKNYKWTHYIDMINIDNNIIMDDKFKYNINKNIVCHEIGNITMNDIVSWYFEISI